MAGEFKFPRSIQYEGTSWQLLYAPDDPSTVMPNLEGSQTLSVTCDPVQVPGRPTPIFIAIVDIAFPPRKDSAGHFIPGRRLKAFRTFARQPYSPDEVKAQECAYYIAANGEQGSAAQRFFDALIGQAQAEQPKKADASWCKDLALEVTNEPGTVSESPKECCVSD